jgi:hypothetical protein
VWRGGGERACQQSGEEHAGREADERRPQALSQNLLSHLRRSPAKRQPDPYLTRALSDGMLAANAYRHRPRTTEDIHFLVGDEAFELHGGGFVTMRVPVVGFDGVSVDQVPLTDALRVVEDVLNHAPTSEGVPVAPVEVVVIMKLLAGRTQDHADIEAIIDSGADRERLRTAVGAAAADCADTLERLFANVDRGR